MFGWCAGECFFRGLAGRLDLFLFLRPAAADTDGIFVWMAELVAMARRVAVCLRGTAELLNCWTGNGAPYPWGAELHAADEPDQGKEE